MSPLHLRLLRTPEALYVIISIIIYSIKIKRDILKAICFQITIINSWGCINIFWLKKPVFFKRTVRRVVLSKRKEKEIGIVFHFLFDRLIVWFYRRQLGSHICFCTQTVVNYVSAHGLCLRKPSPHHPAPYAWKKMRVEKVMRKTVWPRDCPESWGPTRSSGCTLKTAGLETLTRLPDLTFCGLSENTLW